MLLNLRARTTENLETECRSFVRQNALLIMLWLLVLVSYNAVSRMDEKLTISIC